MAAVRAATAVKRTEIVAYACPSHGVVVRAVAGAHVWCRCGRKAAPVEQQQIAAAAQETKKPRRRGRAG